LKINLRIIFYAICFIFLSLNISAAVDLEKVEVNKLLDNFHVFASKADEAGYIDSMASDGIFLGTDPDEFWTKEQFKVFVHKYFSKGIGWTYTPSKRRTFFSKNGKIAWFSEDLNNEKYGRLRGSGVLRKEDTGWKIVQYNMVFVIPNNCTSDVVSIIKKYKKKET